MDFFKMQKLAYFLHFFYLIQGPVAYSDIATRERLDRPMVKVFQRHPGTQLPEAQEIIRVGVVKF